MDFRYAQYGYGDDATEENKEVFCDRDKAIQVKCLFGFFCSSSSQMEVSITTNDVKRRGNCFACLSAKQSNILDLTIAYPQSALFKS